MILLILVPQTAFSHGYYFAVEWLFCIQLRRNGDQTPYFAGAATVRFRSSWQKKIVNRIFFSDGFLFELSLVNASISFFGYYLCLHVLKYQFRRCPTSSSHLVPSQHHGVFNDNIVASDRHDRSTSLGDWTTRNYGPLQQSLGWLQLVSSPSPPSQHQAGDMRDYLLLRQHCHEQSLLFVELVELFKLFMTTN